MSRTMNFAALLLLCVIALSCSKERVKTPVEKYVETLVKMYPNYETNDIARAAVKDSVTLHMKAAVGKPCVELQDVKFGFRRIVENGGQRAALFDANVSTFNDVDGKQSMYSDILMHVMCVVDDETAATLDGQRKYAIAGTLDDWGENDLYMGISTTATIDFGILLLNKATIKTIEDE